MRLTETAAFPRLRYFPHPMLRLGLLTLMALVLIACGQSAPHQTGTLVTLPISAPTYASAGDSIAITIGPAQVADGTPVGLVMVGAYGPRTYTGQFAAGMAEFIIPAEHTRQPGYLAFIAAADHARGQISVILAPDDINVTAEQAGALHSF